MCLLVPTYPDEADLIARARSGDLAAFNVLVERCQGAVYNLCLRMLGSAPAAEDVAQETFISAYRSLGRFRDGAFRSWLFRIAANACYDELRRRRSRPAVSLERGARGEDDERPVDMASPAPGPAEQLETAELGRVLQAAISSLPSDQRLAVVLRDVQGLEYAEIAAVMDVSLGTVKSRLNRARLRLRTLLLTQRELLPSRFRPSSEDT